MNMEHPETVVLITRPPYQQRRSEEMLEAVMSLALFDMPHCVIFWDLGLAWLTPDQAPSQGKALSKQLSALPFYGSEALYYCQPHRAGILGEQAVNDTADPLTLAEIAAILRGARHVEVF